MFRNVAPGHLLLLRGVFAFLTGCFRLAPPVAQPNAFAPIKLVANNL